MKKDDPRVLTVIREFWGRLDPTIDTIHNERLLEHWERIHYVRNNFTENRNLVYPSDERGSIFIKYGAPDRIKSGSFRFNTLRINAWAEDMTMLNTPGQRVISDTSTNAPSIISNVQSGASSAQSLTEKALDYFTHPKYEIWIYERYKDPGTGDNLIFIFGDDASSGDFELLNSLEDLIPSRAFNPSIGRSANPTATPGILLQMLLYDQTATVDSYFGNALMDLESEALSSTDTDLYLGSSARSKNRFEMARIQVQAPQQTSTYLENLPEIEMDVQQYRMLDPETGPYFLTFLYSSPFNIIFSQFVKDPNLSPADIKLEHTAQLRDEDCNLIAHVNDKPELTLINKVRPVQSIFTLPYISESTQQVFDSSLNNSSASQNEGENNVFSHRLLGLGKKISEPPAPLSTDPTRLEMADLILGYDNSIKSDRIPFYVPKERNIPSNKNLRLHFEVYHLNTGSSGTAEFTASYKVTEEKKLGFLRGKDQEVSLTLNYETDQSFFAENLEIETRELEPGNYTLTFTVRDLKTNQTLDRKIEFQIAE